MIFATWYAGYVDGFARVILFICLDTGSNRCRPHRVFCKTAIKRFFGNAEQLADNSADVVPNSLLLILQISAMWKATSKADGKQASVGHTDEPLQIFLVLLHTIGCLLYCHCYVLMYLQLTHSSVSASVLPSDSLSTRPSRYSGTSNCDCTREGP